MPDAGEPRELSNTMSGVLLACVRHEGGDDAVSAVLGRAGDTRALEEICDSVQWSSYKQTRLLFQAAVAVTGDPELPRRAGEQLLGHYVGSEVIAMLRSLEGPAAVLQLVADLAAKQTTISTVECLEHSERSAVVSSRLRPDFVPDALFCAYRRGLFASIPALFGFPPAQVNEAECQSRGDARCLYLVAWEPSTSAGLEHQVAFLTRQVDALASRFEALEATASELAMVGEIDDVLQTITTRAATAVRAPHYLLAVHLPDEESPRICAIGIDPDRVAQLAAEILSDAPDDHGGARLFVDIVGAKTRFGRLAAMQPDGYRFVPEERRLLAAYAGHAAAALQTAAAWNETRTEMATLTALLDLSTALADVRSEQEAADRLAAILPKVLGADEAVVWTWQPSERRLIQRSHSNREVPPPTSEGEGTSGHPGVAVSFDLERRLVGTVRPLQFAQGDGPPELRDLGTRSGIAAGAVMPIVAQGELFGVTLVAAPDPGASGAVGRIAARLPGVSRLAATAFATARLLEQIRDQARHDPLTGLPNLRVLEELTLPEPADGDEEGALAGLLFIDLDRFKRVNDDFGHAAGDELLREIGQRLRRAVRPGDRVVRIGGDEFAVVLGQLHGEAEAAAVAGRLQEAVIAPFGEEGERTSVTASIGVALGNRDESTVEELLSRADAAMYEAKRAGRATIRFAQPPRLGA